MCRISVQFGIGANKKLWSKRVPQKRSGDMYTLLKRVNKFQLVIFDISWPMWVKCIIWNSHVLPVSVVSLATVGVVEDIFYFRAWMKFCQCFLHFSSALEKIRYRRCAEKCIEWFWVAWKSAHWNPFITYSRKWIIFRTSHIEHVLSNLDEIRYTPACSAVSWKSAQGISCFSGWECLTLHIARTVKLNCATEYAICSLVVSGLQITWLAE